MKTPEQLPLDFAAPSKPTVVSLESARRAKTDQRLGQAYQAIRDSIKHIDVRRALPADGHPEPPSRQR